MIKSESFTCPVCGYPDLAEPPYDEHGCALFGICPCCGVEFGYDDATKSHDELRREWLAAGAPWRSERLARPAGWDALKQLHDAGFE